MWVDFRPAPAGPPDARRRDLARPTRLRWLAGGLAAGWRWDAFLAPAGRPLAGLVAPGAALAWGEAAVSE